MSQKHRINQYKKKPVQGGKQKNHPDHQKHCTQIDRMADQRVDTGRNQLVMLLDGDEITELPPERANRNETDSVTGKAKRNTCVTQRHRRSKITVTMGE